MAFNSVELGTLVDHGCVLLPIIYGARKEVFHPDFARPMIGGIEVCVNSVQIFKKTIHVHAAMREEDIKYVRHQRLIELGKDIERALLYGMYDPNSSDRAYRTMGGLSYFLPSEGYNANFLDNEDNFGEFCRFVSQKTNSSQAWILVPSSIAKRIRRIPWGYVRYESDNSLRTIPITQYIDPHISLYFIESKFINNELFIIKDIDDVVLTYLRGRDFISYSRECDIDGVELSRNQDAFLAEYGLWIKDIKYNYIIKLIGDTSNEG